MIKLFNTANSFENKLRKTAKDHLSILFEYYSKPIKMHDTQHDFQLYWNPKERSRQILVLDAKTHKELGWVKTIKSPEKTDIMADKKIFEITQFNHKMMSTLLPWLSTKLEMFYRQEIIKLAIDKNDAIWTMKCLLTGDLPYSKSILSF